MTYPAEKFGAPDPRAWDDVETLKEEILISELGKQFRVPTVNPDAFAEGSSNKAEELLKGADLELMAANADSFKRSTQSGGIDELSPEQANIINESLTNRTGDNSQLVGKRLTEIPNPGIHISEASIDSSNKRVSGFNKMPNREMRKPKTEEKGFFKRILGL